MTLNKEIPISTQLTLKSGDQNSLKVIDFDIENPLLWYPRNLGPQNFYNINVTISSKGSVNSVNISFSKR